MNMTVLPLWPFEDLPHNKLLTLMRHTTARSFSLNSNAVSIAIVLGVAIMFTWVRVVVALVVASFGGWRLRRSVWLRVGNLRQIA